MTTSLYLLHGEDSFRKSEYIKNLKKEVLVNSDENLNFDRVDGEKDDLDTLQDIIERSPFLGDRRLILIEKAPFFGGKCEERVLKYLESYMDNPISTNIILFVVDKVDKRSRLFKKIKKSGEVIELNNPRSYEVESIVREKISSLGLSFKKDAVNLLIQNTNGNLGVIEQELNKLSAVAEEDTVITKDTVEKYVSSTVESNIFKFVDKLGDNDIEPALKQLNDLLLLEPVPRVYFMVCRQFRLLNKAKMLVQDGCSQAEISKKLKVPGFVAQKLMIQSKKFSLEELNSKMIELGELDYTLKTSGTFDQKYILEKVVIKK
ncbi:DNA polymerase III subunit delta [Natranaerofaba carboxydovora]|uniref:DNA polymerase III subunit delta n=1 Tax=Natranaerofaba carboxydovora TaxID=2742683 RepID=UPI001F13A3D4|nr:DNA polymerase III subunit delta [Natranaerofaba carboxydovora]UMZ73064.1 DNA polymerase III, delta subunit [Natranaerofaba carboxydovora]